MQGLPRKLTYGGVLGAAFLIGTLAGWTTLAKRIDNYAYDLMGVPGRIGGITQNADTASVVVAVDEATLRARGGMRNIRPNLAQTLRDIAAAKPNVVALDVILADQGVSADDNLLIGALHDSPNLVLPCDVIRQGETQEGETQNGNQTRASQSVLTWEYPLAPFAEAAEAIGHIHPEVDRLDGVSRELSLEQVADGPHGRERRWALALEAFRIARGQQIVESPDDLSVGDTVIPAARTDEGRPMFIRYVPGGITTISALDVNAHGAALYGKTVFVGVTALSAARDRLLNPFGQNVAGVEVHAHAYETLVRGDFLRRASEISTLGLSLAFALTAGLAFAYLPGWRSYVAGIIVLGIAHYTPIFFFGRGIVFPYFGPTAVAWFSCAGAATYQYFFVRRQLRHSESEKSRYQQAIHWAAHEMRTPLTAIQGSSEIMTRYSLPEAKSKQLSEMINSESKRLAALIQTFLDVERLADGQMELKREIFPAADVVNTCLSRVAPIAERKKIQVTLDTAVEGSLMGDRELMEYALYNLLTNAVKYSPAETHVSVTAERQGGQLRLSVRDQGIGIDAKDLTNVFKKFYRTQKAEQSGEVGTGIGLSIVEQIVAHHGGRMEVSSNPGQGSCFTMVLKSGALKTEMARTSVV